MQRRNFIATIFCSSIVPFVKPRKEKLLSDKWVLVNCDENEVVTINPIPDKSRIVVFTRSNRKKYEYIFNNNIMDFMVPEYKIKKGIELHKMKGFKL